MACCSEIHTKHVNTLCGQDVNVKLVVPQAFKGLKHLVLDREIIAVCSEIHTKHTNTLCGQKIEFLKVKPGGK